MATVAHESIAESYKQDQMSIVSDAQSEEEANVKLAQVRARYELAWKAYRVFRAAWLQASSALIAAQIAEQVGDGADFVALSEAVLRLYDAEEEFMRAVRQIDMPEGDVQ